MCRPTNRQCAPNQQGSLVTPGCALRLVGRDTRPALPPCLRLAPPTAHMPLHQAQGRQHRRQPQHVPPRQLLRPTSSHSLHIRLTGASSKERQHKAHAQQSPQRSTGSRRSPGDHRRAGGLMTRQKPCPSHYSSPTTAPCNTCTRQAYNQAHQAAYFYQAFIQLPFHVSILAFVCPGPPGARGPRLVWLMTDRHAPRAEAAVAAAHQYMRHIA